MTTCPRCDSKRFTHRSYNLADGGAIYCKDCKYSHLHSYFNEPEIEEIEIKIPLTNDYYDVAYYYEGDYTEIAIISYDRFLKSCGRLNGKIKNFPKTTLEDIESVLKLFNF
jgi:hypothetical protein